MTHHRKGNGVTDLEAVRLWRTYPERVQELLLNNAFCSNCGVASFKPGYNLRMSDSHVLIEGNCAKCDARIARLCN